MQRFALTMLLGALLAAPAFAQQAPPGGPPPDGSSSDQQQMQAARDDARSTALAALAPDHQAKVTDIINRVKSGQLTDARDAAAQIDAILSPKEAQAVLAARDKLYASMHGPGEPPGSGGGPPANASLTPGAPGGPGGPQGGGPPPGGRHMGGRRMRNDAGFALLTLNLDRDQMRSLFANARAPQ